MKILVGPQAKWVCGVSLLQEAPKHSIAKGARLAHT